MNKSKKVGILTLQFSNNYGAMYQVYALSRKLESIGCDVTIIDYKMDSPSLWTYLKHPVALLEKLLERKAFSIDFLKNRRQVMNSYIAEENVKSVFDRFRSDFLNISNKAYTFKDLKNENLRFDTIIVGSDQVWAADFIFSSPAYLLAFVGSTVKKIAYAPSFGKKNLERYLVKTFRKYSKSIEFLSVREHSGVELVKNITGRSVQKVVDPTLLLDSYDQIISNALVPSEEYMVCYRLDQESSLANWFIENVDQLSKKLNLKVVYISPNTDSNYAPWDSLIPSPGELLGLIKNASLVATNSFHGTVFSLLLNTNFMVFSRDTFPDKQNLRMIELLGGVNLLHRFVDFNRDNQELADIAGEAVNWDRVNELLRIERELSMKFLLESLGYQSS